MASHRGLRFSAFLALVLAFTISSAIGRPQRATSTDSSPASAKKIERQDDSFSIAPAKDLALRPEGARKADALAHFVEGASLEENGEVDKALAAYRQVLNVDPGQSELAARV